MRQLLDVAWRVVRTEGTEALTLGRLAERAGVTKPVVYDHFGTRNGLLVALYSEFDRRQTVVMEAALARCGPSLAETAQVIAAAYVACVIAQGHEIPDVLAALAGAPELEATKRAYLAVFMETCRGALAPYAGNSTIAPARLWAMVGAAEALSKAAATGEITAPAAEAELADIIVRLIKRPGA